jgi:hypothetical protein
MDTFPGKKGGIHVLAGIATSTQRIGSLLRTPWKAQPAGKFLQSASSESSL